MGMYICPCDKSNITSFVVGYENGSIGECTFSKILSEKLEKKYKIKYLATGWVGQIEGYAKKKGIDWNAAFNFIASEVLNEALNPKPKTKRKNT